MGIILTEIKYCKLNLICHLPHQPLPMALPIITLIEQWASGTECPAVAISSYNLPVWGMQVRVLTTTQLRLQILLLISIFVIMKCQVVFRFCFFFLNTRVQYNTSLLKTNKYSWLIAGSINRAEQHNKAKKQPVVN